MRLRLLTAILSASSLLALASDPAPQMTEISQKAAKPGDVITVSGLGLSQKNVDEIYLTDHKFDMRVKVVDQKDTAIQFRVPPFAKPGRMQLLFLTKGNDPKLLEQPVYLLIEDPAAEVVAKAESEPSKVEGAKVVDPTPETPKVEPKDAKQDPAKDAPKPEPVGGDHAKTLLSKPDPHQPK